MAERAGVHRAAHDDGLSCSPGLAVNDAVVNEVSVYGALGLATSAYAVGHELAQKLGRPASGRRKVRLQQTLDLLVP